MVYSCRCCHDIDILILSTPSQCQGQRTADPMAIESFQCRSAGYSTATATLGQARARDQQDHHQQHGAGSGKMILMLGLGPCRTVPYRTYSFTGSSLAY